MINSLLQGIKTGLSHWRVVALIYILQLTAALILGTQVYEVLDASLGQSMNLNDLREGFDYAVIYDFLNQHGPALGVVFGQIRWFLLAYLVLGVFINAGVLHVVFSGEGTWRAFLRGGQNYFRPFIWIALLFLLLFACWTGLLWMPFFSSIFWALRNLPSEKTLLLILAGLTLLYTAGLLFLFSWSVVSRLLFLREWNTVRKALWRGLGVMRRHFFPVMGLAGLFMLLQLLVTAGYWWLDKPGYSVSAMVVFIIFILQQGFVLFRIVWRLAIIGGLDRQLTGILNE